MSIHILCLNILLLAATCYPTAIPQIMLPYLARYAGKKGNAIYLCMCNILYAVLCVITLVVLEEPSSLHIKAPIAVWWYFFAMGAVIGLILLGFFIGKMIMFLQGIKVKGFSINSGWQNASIFVFVCTVVLAVLEEVNFRMVWNEVLVEQIGLPVYVFILFSAFFYAVNHLYYGVITFLQKFVTGIILTLFYIFSGQAIIIPVLAHVLQNIVILILGRSRSVE